MRNTKYSVHSICEHTIYVPHGSDSGLYQDHLDNISNIHASLEDSDGICVAGDFNLRSVFWTWDPQASGRVPGNINHSHEIIVIDDCFSSAACAAYKATEPVIYMFL